MTLAIPGLSGGPSFPLVWWRALVSWRMLLLGLCLLLGWLGLYSISWSVAAGTAASGTWRADILLGVVPSLLGLWWCQAVQDLEHRRFAWLLPHLHRVNRRGLLVMALLGSVLGGLAHVCLGGNVPLPTAMAFGLLVFASNLADLGWNGTVREKVFAWTPFLLIGMIVLRPSLVADFLAAQPLVAGLVCLGLAGLWTTAYWPVATRRRRVLLPTVYITALFGDEAAVRRRWFAGRGDPVGRKLAWPAATGVRLRTRNLLQALHGFMRGGLWSRVFLVATFVVFCQLLVAVSDGWEKAGLHAGLEAGAAALWGMPQERPMLEWVNLLLLAYFAGTGAAMVLMQLLNQPWTLFDPLPMSRDSRLYFHLHLGDRHHAAYVLSLLIVAGLPALSLAAAGKVDLGGGWPGFIVVALAVWAILPLGQAVMEGFPGALAGRRAGRSLWSAKVGVMALMITGTMALAAGINWAADTGIPGAAVLPPLAIVLLSRAVRRLVLMQRIRQCDLA